MILRVVGGRIRPGELGPVMDAFRQGYEPVLVRTPGIQRYVLGVRPADDGGHRLAAMSIWDSLDTASAAFDGDLASPRTIDRNDRGAVFDSVAYYEVEAGRSLETAASPTILRLTAGTVSRGLDADIQRELRLRLPDLPPEALEAYVGRRVMGRVVEIAFLSSWTSRPAGLALDGPIWPDISGRYDTFQLDVLEVAMTGRGAPSVTDGGRTRP